MKTILLIDDDPQVRTMFGLALRRNGYHVLDADSGATGLVLARQHLPDLILSDINMPGGDGSSLLRDIRRDPELRSKQVVLMTGRPDLATPRKGMEDGADDFLVKPVDLKALVSCIEARFKRASISWRVEDQMLAQLRSLVPPQLPHEFFTPLAGIIGLTEILRSDFASLTPAEITDIHNDIYQSALRLHRTLRNYLLILELQNVPSESNPPPLPSRAVEESIRAGVSDALRQNNRREDVTIEVKACSISMKPDDLVRIVEELVDNACKFSRQGTPIHVELSADGRLTVTDQGRGMTPEKISHIGAFHQFDRQKHEQQGLGLGLVLVQKLAAKCQTELSLGSQPGQGTQAQVAFSLAK
ncbi:MAG: hybrid sensor histidine kinase/response regulator [Methylacidiphilales bacterium]|nr:hybrid sensor histidine kinase/response regulator [Candidatus Methylacidiphilales bacterium]